MNGAQIHLLFNHWPLILLAVGAVLLLIGEMRSEISHKKTGLWLIAIAALCTIPTQFSGEAAEEVLEQIGAAEEAFIERHETLGFFSAMLVYVLGVLSLISLYMIHNTHRVFGLIRKAVVAGALAGLVMLAITAHTGGEIRHTEIRMAAPAE